MRRTMLSEMGGAALGGRPRGRHGRLRHTLHGLRRSLTEQGKAQAIEEAVVQIIATLPQMFRNLKQQVRMSGDPIDQSKELGQAQVWVLHALAGGSRITSELARSFNVSTPTMTRIVDALVDKRLVERQHDTRDRRCIYLRLTEEGERASSHAHEHLSAAMARFL